MSATCFWRPLLMLLAVLLAPLAWAGDSREIMASGQGASRDAAIADALVRGALQIPSLQAVDASTLRPLFESWVRGESRLPVDHTGYKRQVAQAIDSTAGIIRDYDVLRVTREKAGVWRADLRLSLAAYEVRADSARQRVAIFLLPFSLHAEEEAETGGMEAQAAALRERAEIDLLRERLAVALTPDLIDVRAGDARLLADPRLGLAFDNPLSLPWAELAATLGNAFFIAVDVEDYVLELQPENLRKKEPAYWRARFVLGWRVISAPVPVVMASGRLRLDRVDPQLHEATRAHAGVPGGQAVTRILDVAAQRLARQVEERLVPVQVRSTEGDTIILDVGAVRLAPGDTLAVLGAGLVEKEEGAAMPVALDGPRVAVLQTLTVDRQQARARVLRGNAATLLPGAPVRRLAELPLPRMP